MTDPAEMYGRVLSPAGQDLGSEFLSYELETRTVRLAFNVRPEFANILGVIQGGYVAAMLDEAAGMAAKLILPENRAVPTLDFNVRFLAPSPIGRLIGEATMLKLGRTTAFMESSLLTEKGKLLARMSVTAAVIDIDPSSTG